MWKTIKRFFYWGWKLRHSYDFDSGFLLEMMLLKMKRIYSTLLENSLTVDSANENTKMMRKFRVCIELLERMAGDDFGSSIRKTHYYKRRLKEYTLLNNTMVFEDHKYSNVRDKELENLFWKLFTKHYKTWWD